MENVLDGPVHQTPAFVSVGVTVKIAVTGAFVLFRAVNEAMLPEPLAGSPMEGLVLTQLYAVVPEEFIVVKITGAVEPLLQRI